MLQTPANPPDKDPVRRNGLFEHLRNNTRVSVTIACLVVFAVWFATINSVLSERQERHQIAMDRAQELTVMFEAHVTNVIGYADTYLKAVRNEYQQPGSIAEAQAFMDAAPPNTDIMSHVTIVDANGHPIFISTGDTIDPDVTAADREYFKFQKSTPGDLLYISQSNRGRVSGLFTIRLVRRIELQSGQFDGVILASIKITKLTEPFHAVNLGSNSVVALVGFDKKARALLQRNQTDATQSIENSAIWSALEGAPTGMVRETDPIDGLVRDIAYRQFASYPLIASIGIANPDLASASSGYVWSAFSIATLVTLVIVLLTSASLRDVRIMRTLEREVSVRRRAEIEAVHATEIKTTFLATMSHEIRTPINAILGLFELIEKADIPERQRRQAKAGQTAARDLFKQLTNVLDASRLEANALDLTLRDEPIRPMFVDLAELLGAAISTSGKPLEHAARIDNDVPETINMDRRRVEQIILNFIDNAVKFTAAGRIDLTASVDRTGPVPALRLAVTDTGPGMSDTDQKRIFHRFSQLDSAPTRRAGGTGLGLSISKELAELMQARVDLSSRVGTGSCFALFLHME